AAHRRDLDRARRRGARGRGRRRLRSDPRSRRRRRRRLGPLLQPRARRALLPRAARLLRPLRLLGVLDAPRVREEPLMRRTTATGIALALAALVTLPAAAVESGGAQPARGPLEPAWRNATDMATRSLGAEDAGRLT